MATQTIVVDSGTSYHLLTSIASVADPRWLDVLSGGPALAREATSTGGRDLLAQVRAPGRFGWINLLSVAAAGRAPRTVDGLLGRVAATHPAELHLTMLGAGRRQLVELVPEATLAAVARGDRLARTELKAILAGGDTVLEATPWLLREDSRAVQGHVLQVLSAWRDALLPPEREASLRADLRLEARRRRADLSRRGPEALMAAVAPTLAYAPHPAPSTVVLFPAPAMAPAATARATSRRRRGGSGSRT